MGDAKRRVPVTVVFHTWKDVPAEWTDEDVRFYVQENHCLGNYITTEQHKMDANPGVCTVCSRGVALVGHRMLAEMAETRYGELDTSNDQGES